MYKQLTVHGQDRYPVLDVYGINVQNNRDWNLSGNLGKFKAHWSIGITTQYPASLCISAEIESKY
jgi:hypothetical protein